jgi:hypothetical protein
MDDEIADTEASGDMWMQIAQIEDGGTQIIAVFPRRKKKKRTHLDGTRKDSTSMNSVYVIKRIITLSAFADIIVGNQLLEIGALAKNGSPLQLLASTPP